MPQGCTRPLAKVSTLMACLVFCAGALVIWAERADVEQSEQACKLQLGRMMDMRMNLRASVFPPRRFDCVARRRPI